MKGLWSILLLVVSNTFMTFAWYGHLYLGKSSALLKWGLAGIVLLSWGLALFEYIFMVPANRIGHDAHGGPFSLFQLKIIQEIITLIVFTVIALFVFKSERLSWNHFAAFGCMILAVFFIFRK